MGCQRESRGGRRETADDRRKTGGEIAGCRFSPSAYRLVSAARASTSAAIAAVSARTMPAGSDGEPSRLTRRRELAVGESALGTDEDRDGRRAEPLGERLARRIEEEARPLARVERVRQRRRSGDGGEARRAG